MVVIGWFNLQLWMLLVDLNYNCECDWLIELSDNNFASELVENWSFLSQSQSKKFKFLWFYVILLAMI